MKGAIALGDIARDTLTGFEGVVVAKTNWLHGCTRWTLQPRKLEKGKLQETQSFDEPQLELVKKAVVATTSATGGPRSEPMRRADIRR